MNHALRTIGYFVVWGTTYGFIIGLLSGATAWIAGAMLGAGYGVFSGAVIGIIVGIMTALIHTFTFHQDTDIALYRRRLAAFNGFLVFTIGLGILIFIITDALKRPPRTMTLADFYPLAAFFIPKTVILTALCVAYISSHYPDWLIRTFYSPSPQLNPYAVKDAFNILWGQVFKPLHFIFGIGLVMCFYAGEALRMVPIDASSPNIIGIAMMSFVWSLIVFPCLAAYIVLGNAVLLTFVRRLIFDEGLIVLSTYHYKTVITSISFFFTMLMTAWGWALAPFYDFRFFEPVNTPNSLIMIAPIILGLLTAYHVSHTLAQPDDSKAKRKELESQQAL